MVNGIRLERQTALSRRGNDGVRHRLVRGQRCGAACRGSMLMARRHVLGFRLSTNGSTLRRCGKKQQRYQDGGQLCHKRLHTLQDSEKK